MLIYAFCGDWNRVWFLTQLQNRTNLETLAGRRVEEGTRTSLGFRRATEKRLGTCPGIQLPTPEVTSYNS